MSRIEKVIRDARVAAGLNEEVCAALVGLSEVAFHEVENPGREFFSNVSTGTARRLSSILELDWIRILEGEYGKEISIGNLGRRDFFCRHLLIERRMLECGFSEEKMARKIGFDRIIIEEMLSSSDYLESMTIDALHDTERELYLPFGSLLAGVEC